MLCYIILTSRNDTRKQLESSLLAMEGRTDLTFKMVATLASAHLPQAEGYTKIPQGLQVCERGADSSLELGL